MGAWRVWLGVAAAVSLIAGFGASQPACSPSPAQLPPENNAPPYDGALPALTPDVVAQPTRVIVNNISGPEAGATIVFQDATGTILSTQTTDALGRVAAYLPTGAMVTALLGTAQSPALLTYVDAKPGDLLVAFDVQSYNMPSVFTNVNALPPLPPQLADAGLAYYQAMTGGCGNTGLVPFGFTMNPLYCTNSANQFPLLVLAWGQTSVLGYTYQKNNNLLLDDAGNANLALDGSWATTMGSWTVNVTNVPPSAYYGTYALFSEVANGVLNWSRSNIDASAGDGGAAPLTFTTHPGFADFVQTEIDHYEYVGWGMTYVAIATRSDAPASDGSVTMDLSQLLPSIPNTTVDTTTPARPVVSWSYAGADGGTASGGAAGTYVQLAWSQVTDAGSTQNTWTFVLPPTATTLQAPALPPNLGTWTPNATFVYGAEVVSLDSTPGFGPNEFRQLGAAVPIPNFNTYPNNQPVIPPLPANGTMRITSFGPGGA